MGTRPTVAELQRLIALRDADTTELIAGHRRALEELAYQRDAAEAKVRTVTRDLDSARSTLRHADEMTARLQAEANDLLRLEPEGVAYARCVAVLDPLRTTRYAGGIGPTTGVVDNVSIERVLRFLAIRYAVEPAGGCVMAVPIAACRACDAPIVWAHPWCAVKDGLCLRYPDDTRRDREIDRLRAENDAWMNGVADAVEHLGFDREAACGPADLLPGLRMLRAQIDGSADGAR